MSLLRNRLPYKAILPGVRAIHASYPLQSEYFRKWMYGLDGYNKLGLLKDDFAPQYGEHTQEAIRRLPEQMQMERKYRSIRAIECELHHTILPPEQWTKMEDNHDYLQPYIQEIIEEEKERAEWDAKY